MSNRTIIGSGIVVLALIGFGLFGSSNNSEDKTKEEVKAVVGSGSETNSGDIGMQGEVAGAAQYQLDNEQSSVVWGAKKKVGASHVGILLFKSGRVEVVDEKIVGGTFEVDMTSVTDKDLEDPDMNSKLVNHLKSDAFFSVDEFPESKLVVKSVEYTDDEIGELIMVSDLTIKGITNEVIVSGRAVLNQDQVLLDANMIFDRSLYDVRFGSGKFYENLGDNLIEDEVNISVALVATK